MWRPLFNSQVFGDFLAYIMLCLGWLSKKLEICLEKRNVTDKHGLPFTVSRFHVPEQI